MPAGAAPYGEVAAAIRWRATGVTSAFPDISERLSLERVSGWRGQMRRLADSGDLLAAYLLVAPQAERALGDDRVNAQVRDLLAKLRKH